MARFLGSTTQSGADTFTTTAIDTNITVDSKSALSIFHIEAFWDNGEAVAAADWECNLTLSTIASSTVYNVADEIARISWGVQNTAGVAVAVPYEPQKFYVLPEARVTAQPTIYAQVQSQLTGQANLIRWKIYYEIIKVSEIELLRLVVGGA